METNIGMGSFSRKTSELYRNALSWLMAETADCSGDVTPRQDLSDPIAKTGGIVMSIINLLVILGGIYSCKRKTAEFP